VKLAAALLALAALAYGLAFACRPLPRGCNRRSPAYTLADGQVSFLKDLTYIAQDGRRVSEQQIFDQAFRMIDQAQSYILIDCFLFNPFLGSQEQAHRRLCRELTDHLLAKKRSKPAVVIDFITDPVNLAYGGSDLAELDELRSAGVNVIVTDLVKLRDSNLIYSPLWRVLFAWMGHSRSLGYLPHPFSPAMPPVNLRSYLAAANFKANHRKTLIADSPSGWQSLVSSANPQDASSAHSNVALLIKGAFAREIYQSEAVVARLSHAELQPVEFAVEPPAKDAALTARLLTESAIEAELNGRISQLGRGDKLMVAMFYLSRRPVIAAIQSASARGVAIRIILDPSNDAFGRSKYGIPNQVSAHELRSCAAIRWYRVSGEQFHTKLVLIERQNGESALLLGSANLTRRNLGGYNLETDVALSGASAAPIFGDVRSYFERLWNNQGGNFTFKREELGEPVFFKRAVSRFFEVSGASTF